MNNQKNLLWLSNKFMDIFDSINNSRIQLSIDGNIPEDIVDDTIFSRISLRITNSTNRMVLMGLDISDLQSINEWIADLRQSNYTSTKSLIRTKFKMNGKQTIEISMVKNTQTSISISINDNGIQYSVLLNSINAKNFFTSIYNLYENYFNILTQFTNSLLLKKSINFMNIEINKRLLSIDSKLSDITYKIKNKPLSFNYTPNTQNPPINTELNEIQNEDIYISNNQTQNEFENILSNDETDIKLENLNYTKIKENSKIVELKINSTRPFIGKFLNSDIKNISRWSDAFALLDETSDINMFSPIGIILTKMNHSKAFISSLRENKTFLLNEFYIINMLKENYKSYASTKNFSYNYYISILNCFPAGWEEDNMQFIEDITYLNTIYKILEYRKSKLKNIQPSKDDDLHNLNRFFIKVLSTIFNLGLGENVRKQMSENIIRIHNSIDFKIINPIVEYFSEISAGGKLNLSTEAIESMFNSFSDALTKVESKQQYDKELFKYLEDIKLDVKTINTLEDIKKYFSKEPLNIIEEDKEIVKKENKPINNTIITKKDKVFDIDDDCESLDEYKRALFPDE